MKPEHFIYKSDGLYYMQNVPEYPSVANQFDPHDSVYFADVYTKALERAKEDAVPFNDYFLGLKRILHSMNISCGEGNEELVRISKLHLKEGQVYTINMEKIEIYDMELKSCEYCQNCKLIPACTTLAARIAAPKKEEESEKQVFIVNDLLKPAFKKAELFRRGHNLNGRKINRDQYYEILSELREHINQKFEIKRKPL